MHVVMLGVPQAVTEEWERRLREEGARHTVECQVQHARGLEALPEPLPPGLLVLWDAGGPVQDTLTLCQRLHARREPSPLPAGGADGRAARTSSTRWRRPVPTSAWPLRVDAGARG